MKKLHIKFDKFSKALISLEDVYLTPNLANRANIDATIQRFEFTFELFWKFLKDMFNDQGLELNYPKEVLRQAYKNKIIDDEEIWIEMLKDRNLTSHTYDQILADEIFARIKTYVPVIKKAFNLSAKIMQNYTEDNI